MTSQTTDEFWELYYGLPEQVRRTARKNHDLWLQDLNHPGLHFKEVDSGESIWSCRIGRNYRALCIRDEDTCIWFWIGTHGEYDRILNA